MSLSDFLSQFLIFLLCFDIGQALLVQQNQPCNKDRDILLAEDPTGNPQAFLRCTPVGVGTIGFWERRFCPSDMVFDFIKQQCRAQNPTQNMELNNMLGEEHEVKNIAILNGTCAHGEQCIGGTVCDLETLRCLCPYGTIANLETLSCHPLNTGLQGQSSFEKEMSYSKGKPERNCNCNKCDRCHETNPTPNVNPSGSSTSSYFKPLEPIFGELKNLAKSVSSSMNFNSFTQQPQSPAPTFSSYGGSNNNNNNNGFGNPNMGPIPGGYGPQGGLSNVQPRPSVFLPEAQPIHPINSLVPPGGSCAQGEQCSGGSVCTKPLNLCLCPGNLQDQGGHCVAPGTAPIAPGPRPGQGQVPQQPTQKVGIGAICNQFAVCDYDSTCLNGRCQCVDPLIEHNGKCVLKLVPKEVGPGELCDNGEVCTKGSICDPTIPVCVCPQSTDLENGECVKVQASSYEIPIVTQPQPQPTPQQPQATQPPPIFRPDQEIHGNSNYNNYGTPPTPSVRGPPIATYAPPPVQPQTQLPYQPPPQQPYTQQTQKPNVMKLNLGGAKQAGVGARCALNTDCMIGAYCNGNTNPPTCQCLSTHVNINGRCEKVIYPGQTGCEYDQQCTAAYAGTSCIDRQCVCPTGSKAIEQTCVSEFAFPGDLCNLSSFANRSYPACSGNSFCHNGRCECDPQLIQFQKQCINISDVYLSPSMSINCHRDSDCLPDFLCIENFCECPPNKVRLNSNCIEVVEGYETRRAEGKKVKVEENWRNASISGFMESNPTVEHLWKTISGVINEFSDPKNDSEAFRNDSKTSKNIRNASKILENGQKSSFLGQDPLDELLDSIDRVGKKPQDDSDTLKNGQEAYKIAPDSLNGIKFNEFTLNQASGSLENGQYLLYTSESSRKTLKTDDPSQEMPSTPINAYTGMPKNPPDFEKQASDTLQNTRNWSKIGFSTQKSTTTPLYDYAETLNTSTDVRKHPKSFNFDFDPAQESYGIPSDPTFPALEPSEIDLKTEKVHPTYLNSSSMDPKSFEIIESDSKNQNLTFKPEESTSGSLETPQNDAENQENWPTLLASVHRTHQDKAVDHFLDQKSENLTQRASENVTSEGLEAQKDSEDRQEDRKIEKVRHYDWRRLWDEPENDENMDFKLENRQKLTSEGIETSRNGSKIDPELKKHSDVTSKIVNTGPSSIYDPLETLILVKKASKNHQKRSQDHDQEFPDDSGLYRAKIRYVNEDLDSPENAQEASKSRLFHLSANPISEKSSETPEFEIIIPDLHQEQDHILFLSRKLSPVDEDSQEKKFENLLKSVHRPKIDFEMPKSISETVKNGQKSSENSLESTEDPKEPIPDLETIIKNVLTHSGAPNSGLELFKNLIGSSLGPQDSDRRPQISIFESATTQATPMLEFTIIPPLPTDYSYPLETLIQVIGEEKNAKSLQKMIEKMPKIDWKKVIPQQDEVENVIKPKLRPVKEFEDGRDKVYELQEGPKTIKASEKHPEEPKFDLTPQIWIQKSNMQTKFTPMKPSEHFPLVTNHIPGGSAYLKLQALLRNVSFAIRHRPSSSLRRQIRHKRSSAHHPSDCWPDQTTCASGLGVCIRGICQCTNNFLYKNGECVPEILELEAFCDPYVQSPVCPEYAICRDGVCQCKNPEKCKEKDDKREAEMDSTKVEARKYGEACQEGDICLNGTVCTNDMCNCPMGFGFQDNTCVKSSGVFKPIGSTCSDSDRCSGGSLCSNSICSCVDGSIESQGRCRQRPGGRCSYGQSCAGRSVCELGVCQCPQGKRLSKHTCVTSLSKPGQSCQSGEKCTDGSLCRFGVCMCTADYHVVDHKCEKITSKKTFSMKNHKHDEAKNSTELIVIPPERSRVKSKPGFLCLDGEECIGGSKCKEGYCVCTDQQIIIDDKCVTTDAEAMQVISQITKAAPGQTCSEKIECTGNSVCLAGTCECPDGTFLLYGSCQDNISNSILHHELKESPGTQVQQHQGLVPGSMCRVSMECPYRTECIRGVCRCKQGETIVNGMCRKAIYQVSPMGRCDPRKGLDCIGESHCYYGICVCLYGLINVGSECASPDVLAQVPPGSPCDKGQACLGGSACLGGVCRCAQDEVIDVNKKCAKKTSTVAFYMYPGGPPNVPGGKGQVHLTNQAANLYPNHITAQEIAHQSLGMSQGAQTRPKEDQDHHGSTQGPLSHPGLTNYGPVHKITGNGHTTSSYPSGFPSPDSKFNQIVTANQMTVNLVDPQTLRQIINKQMEKLPILGEACDTLCGGGSKCLGGMCRCEDGFEATSSGKCVLSPEYPLNEHQGHEMPILRPQNGVKTTLSGQIDSMNPTGGLNMVNQPLERPMTPLGVVQNPVHGYQQSVYGQNLAQNRNFMVQNSPSMAQNQNFRQWSTTTMLPYPSGGVESCQNGQKCSNYGPNVSPRPSSPYGPQIGPMTRPMMGSMTPIMPQNGQNCGQCPQNGPMSGPMSYPGRVPTFGGPNMPSGRIPVTVMGQQSGRGRQGSSSGGCTSQVPCAEPENQEISSPSSSYGPQNGQNSIQPSRNGPSIQPLPKASNFGLPGNPCTPQEMCYNGATCIHNLCVCKPGFKPIDGQCQLSKVQLGQMCFINEQCQESGGFCHNGVCKCSNDLEVVSESGSRSCSDAVGLPGSQDSSRKTARPGEGCTQGQNCHYNSICGPISGVCECPMGMETHDGECHIASRARGSQCYSSGFCDKTAYCDNGYCICKVGYVSRFCMGAGQKVPSGANLPSPHPSSTNFMASGGRANFGTSQSRSFNEPMSFGGQNLGSMTGFHAPEDGEDHQVSKVDLLETSEPLRPVNGKDPFGIYGARGSGMAQNSHVDQEIDSSDDSGSSSLVSGPSRGQNLGASHAFPMTSMSNSRFSHPEIPSGPYGRPNLAFGSMDLSGRPSLAHGGMDPSIVGQVPIGFAQIASQGPVLVGEQEMSSQGMRLSLNPNFGPMPSPMDAAYFNQYHLMARGSKTLSENGQNPQVTTENAPTDQPPISVAMPGEYCGSGRICLGNSHCASSYCQCPEGTRINNGICSYSDGILPQHHVPKIRQPKSTSPRRFAAPLESCEGSIPCIEGSTCRQINFLGPICQCRLGKVFFINTCIVERPNIEVRKIGEECTMLHICANGAYCKDGVCTCPRGKQPVAGYCVKISLPGEPCDEGEICSVGSVCDQEARSCVCPIGKQIRNGICEDEVEYEASHTRYSAQNRWRATKNLTDVLLSLTITTEKPEDASKKRISALPGQFCNEDIKCLYDSYRVVDDMRHKLKSAYSSTPLYCSAFNLCTCLPGSVEVYERCMDVDRVRLPGDACKESQDVCSRNSWCHNGKCECLDKKEPINYTCNFVKPEIVGSETPERTGNLPETIESENSILESSKIEKSDFRPSKIDFSNTNLRSRPPILGYKILEIDDSQEKSSEINSKIEKPAPGPLQMKIKVKKLTFDPRNLPKNQKSPLLKDPKPVDGSKIASKEAKTVEIWPKFEKMVSKITCTSSSDCPKGATCKNGACFCDFAEISSKNLDFPPSRTLESPEKWLCNLDEDCHHPNLRCIDGLCACRPDPSMNFLLADDFGSMKNDFLTSNNLKIGSIPCQIDQNCTIPGTTCQNETCNCSETKKLMIYANGSATCQENPGFYGHNFYQLPENSSNLVQEVKNAGQKCDFSYQCQENLTCFKGKCVCLEVDGRCGIKKRIKREIMYYGGFEKADEKIRSPPGGSCSEIEECSGGSVCREGWCVCPDPTMIVMRGICVQTQPRPTVPSQGTTQPTTRLVQTHQNLPHGSSYNSYENQRPAQAYEAKQPNPSVQEEQMGRTMLPAPRKAAPGTNCGPLDICVGGSTCVDGYCICPAGYVASHDTGRCEPKPQPPKAPSQPAQEPKIEQTSQQNRQNPWSSSLYTQQPAYTAKPNYPPAQTGAIRPLPIANGPHGPHPDSYPHPMLPNNPSTLIPRPIITVKAPPSSYVADGRPVSSAESPYPYMPSNTYAPHGTTKLPNSSGFHVITPENSYEKQHILPEAGIGYKNECERRGLICKGGTVCVDLTCQCPPGHILHGDQCVPQEKRKYTNKRRGKTWNKAPRYSRPTESCSNGEICTGGSECHEKQTCVCPPERPILREHNCIVSDEKPLMKHTAGPGEECNQETKCTEQSICYQGICRCQSGYIAISGKCVQLPTTQPTQAPTTTRLAIIAGPGEACGEGRTCGGGSTCDGGICQCPSGMVTIGGNCQKLASTESMETTRPTDAPFGKGYRRLASNEHRCTDDTQCGENSICIVGKCKCRTGYKEVDGACKIMEDVAVAHNRTFSSISNSQTPIKPAESSPAIKSTQRPSQSPSEAPRPRIVGPPIRKPKPKTPSGQPRPPLVTGGGRTNGVGVCPPGNEPLRDESSGDLVLCNGMSPNCPPKSYCYVTGMASEEYNCCKSW